MRGRVLAVVFAVKISPHARNCRSGGGQCCLLFWADAEGSVPRERSDGRVLVVTLGGVAGNRTGPPGGLGPITSDNRVAENPAFGVKMGKGPLGGNRLPFTGSVGGWPTAFPLSTPRTNGPPKVYWDSLGIRTGSFIGNLEAVSRTREPSRRLT